MLKLRKYEIPLDRSVNIMPMIDVAFQLILFFILTASFIKPNQIELDLPQSTSGAKAQENQPLVVTYRQTGAAPEIALNGSSVGGLENLGAAMAKAADPARDPRVELRIDKAAPYQAVIGVIDTVRGAGFPRFSLLTLAADKPLSELRAAPPAATPGTSGPPAGGG